MQGRRELLIQFQIRNRSILFMQWSFGDPLKNYCGPQNFPSLSCGPLDARCGPLWKPLCLNKLFFAMTSRWRTFFGHDSLNEKWKLISRVMMKGSSMLCKEGVWGGEARRVHLTNAWRFSRSVKEAISIACYSRWATPMTWMFAYSVRSVIHCVGRLMTDP